MYDFDDLPVLAERAAANARLAARLTAKYGHDARIADHWRRAAEALRTATGEHDTIRELQHQAAGDGAAAVATTTTYHFAPGHEHDLGHRHTGTVADCRNPDCQRTLRRAALRRGRVAERERPICICIPERGTDPGCPRHAAATGRDPEGWVDET